MVVAAYAPRTCDGRVVLIRGRGGVFTSELGRSYRYVAFATRVGRALQHTIQNRVAHARARLVNDTWNFASLNFGDVPSAPLFSSSSCSSSRLEQTRMKFPPLPFAGDSFRRVSPAIRGRKVDARTRDRGDEICPKPKWRFADSPRGLLFLG